MQQEQGGDEQRRGRDHTQPAVEQRGPHRVGQPDDCGSDADEPQSRRTQEPAECERRGRHRGVLRVEGPVRSVDEEPRPKQLPDGWVDEQLSLQQHRGLGEIHPFVVVDRVEREQRDTDNGGDGGTGEREQSGERAGADTTGGHGSLRGVPRQRVVGRQIHPDPPVEIELAGVVVFTPHEIAAVELDLVDERRAGVLPADDRPVAGGRVTVGRRGVVTSRGGLDGCRPEVVRAGRARRRRRRRSRRSAPGACRRGACRARCRRARSRASPRGNSPAR